MEFPGHDLSNASLTTVAELIDTAFGIDEDTVVNFASIHAIMLILGRKLRILDRQVAVKLPLNAQTASHDFNITLSEIKISAKDEKNLHYQSNSKMPSTYLPSTDHKSDRNAQSKKENVTQVYYVVAEQGPSNQQKQKTSKKYTVESTDDKSIYKDYVFPKRNMIASDEQFNESTRKKYKDTANDSSAKSSKKYKDVKGSRTKSINHPKATETYEEKMIIVERRPSSESVLTNLQIRTNQYDQTPQTLVTTERFSRLKNDVKQLQQQYNDPDLVFYERTSLSNPVAVLQISARLEVIEKAIDDLINLITNASKTNNNNLLNKSKKWQSSMANLKSSAEDSIKKNLSRILNIKVIKEEEIYNPPQKKKFVSSKSGEKTRGINNMESSSDSSTEPNGLTFEELRYRTSKLQDEMDKTTQKLLFNITLKTETTLKINAILGNRLTKLFQKVSATALDTLEKKVNSFTEEVTKTDVSLNKISTQQQEELASLENDIITKLDNFAEAISKQTPDNNAGPELTDKINMLLTDIMYANEYQEELCNKQYKMCDKIKIVNTKLNELQCVKASRDEVEKAIASKISRATFNNMVSSVQFHSLFGNWETHLKKLFRHIHLQEVHWQGHINDLFANLDDFVNIVHLNRLRKDIYKYIGMLNKKVDFMMDLIHNSSQKTDVSPRAVKVVKQESCICCDTVEVNYNIHPTSTRHQMNSNINLGKQRKSHDKDVCYPNSPIPFYSKKRAENCEKCVHLLKTMTGSSESVSSGIIVSSPGRGITSVIKNKVVKPCKECNLSRHKIVPMIPPKSPNLKLNATKRTKQSEKCNRNRESFASERSKRSHASSNRSSKRSLRRIHSAADSFSEDSEIEPIFIVLDDESLIDVHGGRYSFL